MNKGGFSWKRLIGISAAKAKISRSIGIPLSRSGREQKLGRLVSKGCLGTFVFMGVPIFIIAMLYFQLVS